MKTIPVQGVDAWRSLRGKYISFDWSDGWDDYYPEGVLDDVWVDKSEGYPKMYVMFKQGGGYAVQVSETVAVTVHDR